MIEIRRGWILIFVFSILLNLYFAIQTYYAPEQIVYREVLPGRAHYVNGCYYPTDRLFCVNVGNRSWAQVMETCSHEFLHYKYDTEHWE